MSWFAMLMAAGMTNGIMFYSVFEPVHHYTSLNKYSADPTTPDNEIAQSAMMISFFHLGWKFCNIRHLLLILTSLIRIYLSTKP